MKKFSSKEEALKTIFGFDSFRENQGQVIDQILNKKDTLALIATGGGKSLTYQVPAYMQNGLTLVITPLIALMTDQVRNMKAKLSDKEKDTVEAINSFTTDRTKIKIRKNVLNGTVKLLYASPERLENSYFASDLAKAGVSTVVIDEAHCISSWGHDFRPSYKRIMKNLSALGNDFTKLALTATAPQPVISDICDTLDIPEENIIQGSLFRPNLYIGAHKIDSFERGVSALTDYFRKKGKMSGIIYVNTRKRAEELASALDDRLGNVDFYHYHAGLEPDERKKIQFAWQTGEIDVVVATSAFGMGIDKPDIRFVCYFESPKTIEEIYQGIGRAGRDGNPSDCILLFSDENDGFNEWSINQKDDPIDIQFGREQYEDVKKLFRSRQNPECLNKQILKVLGEKLQKDCGNCSNCIQSNKSKVTETYDIFSRYQSIFYSMNSGNNDGFAEHMGRSNSSSDLGNLSESINTERQDKIADNVISLLFGDDFDL